MKSLEFVLSHLGTREARRSARLLVDSGLRQQVDARYRAWRAGSARSARRWR